MLPRNRLVGQDKSNSLVVSLEDFVVENVDRHAGSIRLISILLPSH